MIRRVSDVKESGLKRRKSRMTDKNAESWELFPENHTSASF